MPRHFTKNLYRVDGDVALIALQSRDRQVIAEAIIDLPDLEAVINGGRWHLAPDGKPTRRVYVGTHTGNGRISLHRFLLRPPADMVVDHINHDTLDNRRCNLRVCTHHVNNGNRYLTSAYLPPTPTHTLEEAVRVFKHVYRVEGTALDEELARLRRLA